MQLWARLLSLPPMELWQSTLGYELLGLLAMFAVSFVCVLWLRWPRRRRRRVADGQSGLSGRRGTEARRSRPGALVAQSGGAKARPAAGGQTREQARRQRMDRMETSKKAKRTYDNLVIELERARSTSPDAGASAPAEKGNDDDEQECKQDIQPRPRHRVRAAEVCTCAFCMKRTHAAVQERSQARPRSAASRSHWSSDLASLASTFECGEACDASPVASSSSGLCRSATAQGAKEARPRSAASRFQQVSDLASLAAKFECDEGEAGGSSPVASSSASGPHPRSALRASSSAAGSAAFGAARREGKTTSLLPRGGELSSSSPARSGASSSPTTPIKTQRMRISSGAQFYAHIVQKEIMQARTQQLAHPNEQPEPRPAATSGLRTPTLIKRRSISCGDMQDAIGLSQRLVPVAESPAAETKTSRPQAPTLIERNLSSGGHRASSAKDMTPSAKPRPWLSTGSSGDLRLRRLALQNLAARSDVQDPPPQTPLPQPQRRQTRSRPSENLAARGDDSVDEECQSESSIDFSEPEAINNYMSFMLAHELPSLPGDVQDSPPPTPLPQPQRRQTRLRRVHTR